MCSCAIIKSIYFMFQYKIHLITTQHFEDIFRNVLIIITGIIQSTLYIFLFLINSVLSFENLYYFTLTYINSASHMTNFTLIVTLKLVSVEQTGLCFLKDPLIVPSFQYNSNLLVTKQEP